MPTENIQTNPDVNSPTVDDAYDTDEKLPGRSSGEAIRDPDQDGLGRPDVDEPHPSPEDDGDVYPVEDPPEDDQDAVNDLPRRV
jgi:hypothetical protein